MFKKIAVFLIALYFLFLQSNLRVFAEEIKDDLVEQTLKCKNLSKPVITNQAIKDDVSAKDFKKEDLIKVKNTTEIISPDIPQGYIQSQDFVKPDGSYKLIKEFSDRITVPVASTQTIKSAKRFIEGQKLNFVITENIKIKDKVLISQGTPVEGILETITKASHGGDPAEIVVGRFTTKDVNGNKVELTGEVHKSGLNLVFIKVFMDSLGTAWWVFPPFSCPLVLLPYTQYCYWGGNAKISPKNKFSLQYEE